MNKEKIFFIYAATSVFLLGAIAFLAVTRISLKHQLEQTRLVLSKTEASVAQLQKAKGAVLKENEKLQADTLSYLSLNNELQQERDKLQNKLQELQNSAERQKESMAIVQRQLDETRQLTKVKTNVQKALLKEKEQMQARLKKLEGVMNNERGVYHYNLAVAYTKAMFVNKAVQEYEKSLEFDPGNAEAHFNLGLLYKNLGRSPERALTHFRRYLELKPNAEDAPTVRDSIEQLMYHNDKQLSVLKSEIVAP